LQELGAAFSIKHALIGAAIGAIHGGIRDGWRGAAYGAAFGALFGLGIPPVINYGARGIAGAFGFEVGRTIVATQATFLVCAAVAGVEDLITAETPRERLAAGFGLFVVAAGVAWGRRPKVNPEVGRGTYSGESDPVRAKLGQYLADFLGVNLKKTGS